MKVLVTLDTSAAANKVLTFVGQIFGQAARPGLEITLFHVVETLPEFILSRTKTSSAGAAFQQVADEWAKSNHSSAEKLLAEATRQLTTTGIPAAAIKTKLVTRDALPESARVVAALAVIAELQSGNYDVIVAGRRSNADLVETIIGGVAEKVVRAAHGKTVWIVD